MFQRAALVGFFLLACFGIALGIHMIRVRPQDRISYDAIVHASLHRNPLEAAKNQQHRQQVKKDIYIMDGPVRRHVHLLCDASTLEFSIQEERTELIEHMQGVTGLLQEELFFLLPDQREVVQIADGLYQVKGGEETFLEVDPSWIPMQEVRSLAAERASYYYLTNRFVAQDTKVHCYRTEGHVLMTSYDDLKPTMTGMARTAEFQLGGGFRASHMQAIIYENKGLL